MTAKDPPAPTPNTVESSGASRRSFLSISSAAAMAGGLAGGYGCLGVMAGRFLYPTDSATNGWMFVAPAEDFSVGDVLA